MSFFSGRKWSPSLDVPHAIFSTGRSGEAAKQMESPKDERIDAGEARLKQTITEKTLFEIEGAVR